MIRDKVLVKNGCTIGEYEVVNERQADSITKEKYFENLHSLPQSNSAEYIMNWFKKHIPESNSATFIKFPKNSEGSATEDSFFSFESSIDESENENLKKINVETITFRKSYRKTRKSTKDKSPVCKNIQSSVLTDDKTHSKSTEMSLYVAADYFSNMEQFSKESGIVTLPNSINDESNIFEDKLKKQTPSNKDKQNIGINKPQEISSDYMTCSSNSLFEKNVFEVTDDISLENLFPDEPKSVKDLEVDNAKSEGVGSTDISFISISEVYKYVDKDEGIVLYERRLLKTPSECNGSIKSSTFSSKLSSLPETIDYDTDTLRKELTIHGFNPGPITVTTKRVYLKKLHQLKKYPALVSAETKEAKKRLYSVELEKTIRDMSWCSDLSLYKSLEDAVSKQFGNPDPSRKWREGVNKASFTYLLLDPRITNNLPGRADSLKPREIWESFLSSIFYVGKGKRSRPYSHLYEAVNLWNKEELTCSNKKIQNIINIWKSNSGVICLHVFQNIIPAEAYTREAAMISALKIENLTNAKTGDFYGIAATWPQKQKRLFGVYLLYRAMMIFLNEGERQLCPSDIE